MSEISPWAVFFDNCLNLKDEAIEHKLDKILKELSILKDIDANVKAIIEGPFNSGLLFLEEAAEPRRSSAERITFVIKARDRFIDALGMENNPIRSAVIQIHIAGCWSMLGEKQDALNWIRKAYRTVERAMFTTALEIDEENFGSVRFLKKVFRNSRNSEFEEKVAPLVSFINAFGKKLAAARIETDESIIKRIEQILSLTLVPGRYPCYLLSKSSWGENKGLIYLYLELGEYARRLKEEQLKILKS